MNKGLLLLVCCSVIYHLYAFPGIDLSMMHREDMSKDAEFLRFRTQQGNPVRPKLLSYIGEKETECNYSNLITDHATKSQTYHY